MTAAVICTKESAQNYRPAVLVVLVLVLLATVSIARAGQLLDESVSFQIESNYEYVSTQIEAVQSRIEQAATGAAIDSAQNAVNLLIAAVVAIAAIAIGAVIYLNVKLVRLNRQLDTQSTDLRDTNFIKGRFLTSATHELNTPLTVTTALTDVLAKNRDGNLTDRQINQITAIQRNNRHLQDMVDVMIQTSVAGESRKAKTESIKYSDFIQKSLESIKADLDLQGVNIKWAVTPSQDRVSIDSERIVQVVSALLTNAGQNSPEGAIVLVSTERVDNNVMTCVRDFGPGIPSVDQPHVFSPFYRVDTELNRRNRSAGLGLTLVKRVVESHGGEVTLRSESDKPGVTFCFTLPVAS